MTKSKSRVVATSESDTRTVVKTRGFSIVIDEPEVSGGTNQGPTPVEYFLASLSGCLNIICHMVAKELGINLRKLKIDLSGTLNSDVLRGISNEDRAGFQAVDVIIKADTDADSETLEKWVKIVEARCPVSDNIGNATPVNISLK